jgi:hypothetical protein
MPVLSFVLQFHTTLVRWLLGLHACMPVLLFVLHVLLQVGTRRPWWYLYSRAYWWPCPADQVAALRRVAQQVSEVAVGGLAVADSLRMRKAGIEADSYQKCLWTV